MWQDSQEWGIVSAFVIKSENYFSRLRKLRYIFPSRVNKTKYWPTSTWLFSLVFLLTSPRKVLTIKMTDLKKSLKKPKSFLHVSVPSVLLQSCCNVPVILVAFTLLKARAVLDSWKPLLPFTGIFHLQVSVFKHTVVQRKMPKSFSKCFKRHLFLSPFSAVS